MTQNELCVVRLNLNSHFIDEIGLSIETSGRWVALPKVKRMRTNKQMNGHTRKRIAGRCFSAATGACCWPRRNQPRSTVRQERRHPAN